MSCDAFVGGRGGGEGESFRGRMTLSMLVGGRLGGGRERDLFAGIVCSASTGIQACCLMSTNPSLAFPPPASLPLTLPPPSVVRSRAESTLHTLSAAFATVLRSPRSQNSLLFQFCPSSSCSFSSAPLRPLSSLHTADRRVVATTGARRLCWARVPSSSATRDVPTTFIHAYAGPVCPAAALREMCRRHLFIAYQ